MVQVHLLIDLCHTNNCGGRVFIILEFPSKLADYRLLHSFTYSYPGDQLRWSQGIVFSTRTRYNNDANKWLVVWLCGGFWRLIETVYGSGLRCFLICHC